MPAFQIRGLEVDFPYTPYDCQKIFMEKVIMSLQNSQHCLLESPTGTGKTLSLLCASLAWRQLYSIAHKRYSNEYGDESSLREMASQLSSTPENENFALKPPKIIYTSRTHSQLSQVVKELKKTIYRPKISVLGSRDHLCAHEKVQQVPSIGAKNSICRKLVSNVKCPHYLEVANAASFLPKTTATILDIEDLASHASRYNACPYYLSREGFDDADIIFAPYNYLIDKQARRAQNIDVLNAIIIFDEAHNLESSCNESTSFEISSLDIATAILEVEGVRWIIKNSGEEKDISEDWIDVLKAFLVKMEDRLLAIELDYKTGGSATLPGSYVLDFFNDVGLTSENAEEVVKVMNTIIDLINNDMFLKNRGNSKSCLNIIYRSIKQALGLESKVSAYTHAAELDKYYKVHVQEIQDETRGGARRSQVKPRLLSCWCFSAGVALKELVETGVRNVILTSGTLSPMASFAAELQIPFEIQLENPHVIQRSQILVGVVKQGPMGKTLSSSYGTRGDVSYLEDLGSSLDGLLVFFPSYGVMDICLGHWQKRSSSNSNKSIIERIQSLKTLIMEPRNRKDFPKTLSEYEKALATGKGAVFFAVCRGKLSEGVDFSDAKARAVVVTGIPFPPIKDPKVELKRKFLDDQIKQGFNVLSGSDWYSQQASRAVNQAIGRVIRHKNDYGAIFLCDERFSSTRNKEQLSLWLRSFVQDFDSFGKLIPSITQFYKTNLGLQQATETKSAFQAASTFSRQRSFEARDREQNITSDRVTANSHWLSRTSSVPSSFKAINIKSMTKTTRSDSNPFSDVRKIAEKNPMPAATKSKIALSSISTKSLRDCVNMSAGSSSSKASETVIVEKKNIDADNIKTFFQKLKSFITDENYNIIKGAVLKIHSFPEEREAFILQIVQILSEMPQKLLELENYVAPKLRTSFAKVREAFYETKKSDDWTFDESTYAGIKKKVDRKLVGKSILKVDAKSLKRKTLEEVDDQVAGDSTNQDDSVKQCAICFSTAVNPLCGPCGHLCCKSCWSHWLSLKTECPVCRTFVREKQLTFPE